MRDNVLLAESDFKRRGAIKRYTMVIEPAAHPEARSKLVVEAADNGDAYDQANDHAAAESPYRCTIAIEKVEKIGDGVGRLGADASLHPCT